MLQLRLTLQISRQGENPLTRNSYHWSAITLDFQTAIVTASG